MKNILVRQPCYSFGNIGDLALVKTVKNTYKNCNLIIPSSVKELNNTDISNIDFLIYFGNDCIAYYDISENIIRKFLSKKKNVYLLNTSWGGNPEKDNVKFLNEIKNDPNFFIYMRDKYSLNEINKIIDFKNKPILVADLAFLCNKSNVCKFHNNKDILNNELDKWFEKNKLPIIAINLHKDFKEKTSLVEEQVVSFINNNKDKYKFLFIPHDTRKKEHSIHTQISKKLKNVDYYLSSYLDPEYEKFILQKVYLVITGRMHLSILTIPNSIPAIAIAYNGVKAKGTFQHWNIEDLVIEPSNICNLQKIVDNVETNYLDYVNKINNSRENVLNLSRKQIII